MTAATATTLPGRRRGLLWPTVATLIAFALLVGLGLWQLRRLDWKLGLIATIEARTTAPPVPLPSEADWPGLSPADYAYRHVSVQGTFDHAGEVRLFRPLEEARGPFHGLGDLILTPLRLPSGAVVIVDRGFVPEDRTDPATRAAGQVEGPVTVTGLMREPEGRNLFTPADDPKARLWFTRDPASVAVALGLTRAAPFSIDADASAIPGGLPQGGETVLSLPNNHLSYALTWFGLAGGLLLVYAAFAWRMSHSPRA